MSPSIWLQWVDTHRGSTANLLDPFVDPVVEKHMTIAVPRCHLSSPPLEIHLGIDEDEAEHIWPGSQIEGWDSKRCRSPQQPNVGSIRNVCGNTHANPLYSMTLPKNKRSKQNTHGATLGTTDCTVSHVNKNRDIKWRAWFASYPKVTEVEKALEGCGVSQVMRPWDDPCYSEYINGVARLPAAATIPFNLLSAGTKEDCSDSCNTAMADVERAMEGCHVSLKARRPKQPPPPPRAPSNPTLDNASVPNDSSPRSPPSANEEIATLANEYPPVTEPLLRLSTSTIICQQNLIWNQIQLERQEHPGAVPIEARSRSPGEEATLPRRSNERVVRNRSSRSFRAMKVPNQLGSRVSTRDLLATESSTLELSSRHSRTTMESASGRSIRNRALDDVSTNHVPTYRYTKGPKLREFSFSSGSRKSGDNSVARSSVSGEASVSLSSHDAIHALAAATLEEERTDDDDDEVVTVPCLECAVPLCFSTRDAATKLVVYCPTCGTMASAELMRSFIGTRSTTGTERTALK